MISRKAFTLIELLVVIAIIAILAVVVVLTLNPAELLRQARDSNRLSDLATLNSAINIYATDQSGSSGFSLGNASSVYLSVPDATSTCQNLGIPSSSGNFSFACAASTSSRNINGQGWIPVDLTKISSGSPLGSLPQDSVNQTSSGLYYTYSANSTQFEVTSLFESQKYKTQFGSSAQALGYPEVNAQGSSLAVSQLYNPNGLLGYWPLDEGTGTTARDVSGNGYNGTWTRPDPYDAPKVGSYAGYFNISTPYYISVPNIGNASFQGGFTANAWVNMSSMSTVNPIIDMRSSPQVGVISNGQLLFYLSTNGVAQVNFYSPTTSTVPIGAWTMVSATYDGAYRKLYLNGVLVASTSTTGIVTTGQATMYIGYRVGGSTFSVGDMDDVRVYNRALSAAEIQAIYNAEK